MPQPNFRNIMKTQLCDKNESKSREVSTVASLVEKLEKPAASAIPFNFKIIPREKLRFHKQNNYPQEEIEKLSQGILDMGLIHNIEAVYEEEDDMYTVESGERRTRAIDYLLDKYKDYGDKDDPEYKKFLENVSGFISGMPVNVKKARYQESELSTIDAIDSEIRLIDANEEVRPVNPQNRAVNIAKRAELLARKNQLLRAQGKSSEVININKTIAQSQGITERQVQTYRALNDLIPELLEEFENKKITLTDSSNYAKLSAEEQRSILELVRSGEKVSAQDIKKLQEDKQLQQTIIEEKERALQEKQKEIETLKIQQEREQKKSEEEVKKVRETANRELSVLQEQIEEERKKKEPSEERIVLLEQQIRETGEFNKRQLASANRVVADKEALIERLQSEINELKSAKPSKEELEFVKLGVKMTSLLDQIEKNMTLLLDLLPRFPFSGQDEYKDRVLKMCRKISDMMQDGETL